MRFKIGVKYILFHKPVFHRLINVRLKTQPFQYGKANDRTTMLQQFLSGSLLKLKLI